MLKVFESFQSEMGVEDRQGGEEMRKKTISLEQQTSSELPPFTSPIPPSILSISFTEMAECRAAGSNLRMVRPSLTVNNSIDHFGP